MRRTYAACALTFVVLATSTAHADERTECAHAYEQAQRLQQSDENRKALDAAERCAQPSCPALLAEECKPWVNQLRQRLAGLDVRATGPDGCPMRDVTIEIDRVKHLPSTEVLVDAGIHEVRVVDPATTRVVDKTINVARGERRIVELAFGSNGAVCGAATAPPSAPPPRGIPKLAIGLGIAGGAFLLTGVVFGVAGAAKRSDLDSCKPNCDNDQIDGARKFFVVGDVLGAFGVLTLGAAVAAYFLSKDDAGMRATSIRVVRRGVEVRF